MDTFKQESFESRLRRVAGPGRTGWEGRAAVQLAVSRQTVLRYVAFAANGENGRIAPAFLDKLAVLEAARSRIQAPSLPDMLRGYAQGLRAMQGDLDTAGCVRTPFPNVLMRSFNLAAAARSLRFPGASLFPTSLAELLERASTPVFQWMPTLNDEPYSNFLSARLLEGGETTRECLDLAAIEPGDVADAETAYFEFLRQRCTSAGTHEQSLYVGWRTCVIEHPVVESYSTLLSDPALRKVPNLALELIQFFYDFVPPSQAVDGHVLLCPTTRTRLRRLRGQWVTEARDPNAQRALLTEGPVRMPYTPQCIELKRPVRQFWTFPGRHELDLKSKAEARGWECELWPKLDAVDLLLSHPRKRQMFAVDVKDHLSPLRLARTFPGFSGYRRRTKLIVIPDYVDQAHPRYADLFHGIRKDRKLPTVALATMTRMLGLLEAAK